MKRPILIAAALLLVACDGGEHRDLQAELADMSKGLPRKIDPLPQVKPYQPHAYASFDLAEPFSPAKIKLDPKAEPTKGHNMDVAQFHQNRSKEPLEAYPLESLRMVGTLLRSRQMNALVKADVGLYRIKVGNYLGQNFGVVTKISDSEIVLKELIQDGTGDWSERTSTLLLQEAEIKK